VTNDDITAITAFLTEGPSGVETDAQLLVRFAGGAIGSVHASWASRAGTDHQLTVIGTDGTLHLDARTALTRLSENGERVRVELPDATGSPLDEFLAAIRGEREPSVTAHDGRAAVAVVEAAYRSAREAKVVTVT
jgi:predicted dehydrogenase